VDIYEAASVEIDKRFDKAEDVSKYLDVSQGEKTITADEKGKCGFPSVDDPALR